MNYKKDDIELNNGSECNIRDNNQEKTGSPDTIKKEYMASAQLTGKRKFILIVMTLMWICFVTLAMINTIKSKPEPPAMNKEIRLFTILPYLNIMLEGNKSASKTSINILNTNLMEDYKEKAKTNPDNGELQLKIVVLKSIMSGNDESSDARKDFEKYRESWKNKDKLTNIFNTLYFYKTKPEITKTDASGLETEINETMTGWVKDYSLFKLYSFSANTAGKQNIIKESEKQIYSMGPGLLVFGFLIISASIGSFLLLFFAVVLMWRAFQKSGADSGNESSLEKEEKGNLFSQLFSFFTFDPKNSLEGRGVRDQTNLKFISMIFWKAWLSFLVWEFSRNILSVIVMLYYEKFQSLPVEGLVLLTVIKYAVTIWFVFVIFRFGSEKFDLSKIGIQKIPFISRIAELMMGAGGYCTALPLVISAALIYRVLTGSNPVSQNPAFNFMDKMNSPVQIGLLFLLVGVIGPIFEEFLFRGVLYTSLRRFLPAPVSIFLISFLFAFIHFDPNVMIGLFTLGMVMNVLYEKTGSLIPSIVTHCLWNSVTFFLYISLYS